MGEVRLLRASGKVRMVPLLRLIRGAVQPSFRTCKSCEFFSQDPRLPAEARAPNLIWGEYLVQPMDQPAKEGPNGMEDDGPPVPAGEQHLVRTLLDKKSAIRKGVKVLGAVHELGTCLKHGRRTCMGETCGDWR